MRATIVNEHRRAHSCGRSVDQRLARLGWSGRGIGISVGSARRRMRGVRTLSLPDYNTAPAYHLHFGQAGRGRDWSFCR